MIRKLEAAIPVMQHGRLYLRHLQQSKTALRKASGYFDSMCILNNNAQIELQWWEYNIKGIVTSFSQKNQKKSFW